jgi:hypothetical protein
MAALTLAMLKCMNKRSLLNHSQMLSLLQKVHRSVSHQGSLLQGW